MVKEVLNLLRSTLPATIEIEEHLDTACRVMCDPAQIHQIVVNLCTNAVQALSGQGRLCIRLDELEPDSEPAKRLQVDGRYAMLSIEDNGPGISAEIIDKIFDPFFTTKPLGKGTGLGLSVVHGIVKNHKGFIRVESREGKGSAFKVYIPVAEEETVLDWGSGESVPTGSQRILFVDDEQPIVSLQKKMLERIGYRVTATPSSADAMEVFCRNPDGFDLLITDMTMPRMTGFELAAAVKRIRPDLPIVLCTGHADGQAPENPNATGISAFLVKPVTRHEMAQTIRRVIDSAPQKSNGARPVPAKR